MRIEITRPTDHELRLLFQPDATDGEPAIPEVYFVGDKLGCVHVQRLVLIGYLIARSHVGNTIHFSKTRVAPHLASRLQQDFAASELFVSPIDDNPQRIRPPDEHGFARVHVRTTVSELDGDAPVTSLVTDMETKVWVKGAGRHEGPIVAKETISTNVRLSLIQQSKEVDFLHGTILSLILSDVCGVDNLSLLGYEFEPSEERDEIVETASYAGVKIQYASMV